MKKVNLLLVLIMLLGGCKPKNEVIVPPNNQNNEPTIKDEVYVLNKNLEFKFTPIKFEESTIKDIIDGVEVHNVYRNDLSLIQLEGEMTFTSDKLYLYNLENDSLDEVNSIKKHNDSNRIWDFVRINKDDYLYIEIYNGEKLNDLMKYEVYFKEELITSGYAENIYKMPQIQIFDDKVYLIATDYSESQTIKVYTIENNELVQVFNNQFKKISYVSELASNSEFKYFVVGSDNKYDLIQINNDEINTIEIWNEDTEVNINVLNDGLVLTTIGIDNKDVFYVNTKGEKIEFPLSMSYISKIQLKDCTLVITAAQDLKLLKSNDEKVEYIVDSKNVIDNAIYLRKVNENKALVYYGENQWVYVEIIEKEVEND